MNVKALNQSRNVNGINIQGLQKSSFRLKGLDCADCAAKLEKRIRQLEGVKSAQVSFGVSKLMVEHYYPALNIMKAVRESGYGIEIDMPEGIRLTELRISGLDCADCAAKLEKRLSSLDGIEGVSLVFGTGKVGVRHRTPVDLIAKAIKEAGYGVEMWREPSSGDGKGTVFKNPKLLSAVLSGLFLSAGFLAGLLGAGGHIATGLYLASILSGGYQVARSGFYAVRSFSLDMNFLMTVAVAGAAAIGEWAEGAMVVFLFALGNYLQVYTIEKTRNSIRSLMDMSPREAVVMRNGDEITVPVEDVMPGDAVVIRPGQNIPVDGKVRAGNSSVNQAPITGESVPVDKGPGDAVYAGTINQQGALEVEAACHFKDTTLSRVINLVEEAQAQKAPSQQLVDRFAFYYTPAVLILAAAVTVLPVFLFGQPFKPWFEKSLMLLVISCPCALVISTPVSIISAIGSAAKRGVLIKGGAYLEEAGKLNIIALDKTGTMTLGRPQVKEIISGGEMSPKEILSLASAVEKYSEHPLARAIVSRTEEDGLEIPAAMNFESYTGKGARAEVEEKRYYVGNIKLFEEMGVSVRQWSDRAEELTNSGNSVVVIGSADKILGIVTLADRVRPGIGEVIRRLKRVGIKRVVMLTGDNPGAAKSVAGEAGVTDFRAGLLPQEKLVAIRELKASGKVAMVGDGVNDAPALALADVGIAMGGAGTDTAIETADIALMADDLSKLPYAIRLSRRALNTIKQNIIFALLLKAGFIAITFMGYGTLWMAVFADTGASLLVTLNGMRLIRVRDD
ncbi:MAG: heavy metal translocating P-type ATPase [Bacillota bacterium]